MEKNIYKVLGLMSGTSLDGLDIAWCSFWLESGKWKFELHKGITIPYDTDLRQKLARTVDLDAVELLIFHQEFGRFMGGKVNEFIQKENIEPDFVASHGHTVFHQPEKGLTYQLGAGQELARSTGLKVICDFRSLDVALGGQGAPLVPIGDQKLFSEYEFCLNLGGIANISFDHLDQRVAFDIAPVNMLFNYLSKQLGLEYDRGGEIAKGGKPDTGLIQKLKELSFYKQSFPKSLGYEWFLSDIKPLIDGSSASVEDKLHTSVIHAAEEINKAILPYAEEESHLLATGGGAKNTFFIETLQKQFGTKVKVVVPDQEIIDFKEAIVFAFLGVLRDRNEVNCLSSVTGASQDTSSGQIFEWVYR